MASSIQNEIKNLMEQIMLLPEGKNFRKMDEIKVHDDTFCLVCHRNPTHLRGEDNCFGAYSLKNTLQYTLRMLDHFRVYNYSQIEKKIFINSINEIGLLDERDISYNTSTWYFKCHNLYETYVVKEYF